MYGKTIAPLAEVKGVLNLWFAFGYVVASVCEKFLPDLMSLFYIEVTCRIQSRTAETRENTTSAPLRHSCASFSTHDATPTTRPFLSTRPLPLSPWENETKEIVYYFILSKRFWAPLDISLP